MKKLLIISIIIATFVTHSSAQELKAGFIFIPQVNLSSADFNDMKVSTALLSNVVFSTKKTYHNLCYVWGANALVLVNGWVYHPQGKQDVYLVLSKNFASSGGNIMLAWETELTNGKTSVWGAIEVGTAWNTWDKVKINLALTIPFNISLWKKK